IRRPRRTVVTIEVKSSSSRISEAASRATSVPRPPMAIPICAALSEGASLTPSPVMATTSPLAFSALTIRNFCSGIVRAKIVAERTRSLRAASLMLSSSAPVTISPDSRLACAAIARGLRIIAGDHDHADAGGAALLNCRRHGRAQRIRKADEAEERERKLVRRFGVRNTGGYRSTSNGEHAHAFPGHLVHGLA